MSSSRICVKNIGKNATEKQLKDLFSSKGEVTDVKIIGKRGDADGKITLLFKFDHIKTNKMFSLKGMPSIAVLHSLDLELLHKQRNHKNILIIASSVSQR